jgi:hypothetical protein
MKYSTSFICLVLALLGGWIFLATYYQELTFPFYPLIDTRLPSGFSQAKFESIHLGMTKTEVLKIYLLLFLEKNIKRNGVLMMILGTMVKTVHVFLEILLGLNL